MSSRILYHFPTSVFSRRARLALAHKHIDGVELRDARANEAFLKEAHALTPLRTMPVFVDEDGRAIADSTALAQYLDLAYPDRGAGPLYPKAKNEAHEAIAIVSAVDVAMNTLVDMGTRNWELRNDPAWERIVKERIARAQTAIDFVASKVREGEAGLVPNQDWTIAEIWALSATLWVAGMPARAKTAPLVAQILTLGFKLPDILVAWSKAHEPRGDVQAIYFA